MVKVELAWSTLHFMAPGRKTGGRSKGTPNRMTLQSAARVGPVKPIDVMLANMRINWFEAHRIESLAKLKQINTPNDPSIKDDFAEARELRRMAHKFAKDAAPYCHPKMSPDIQINTQLTLADMVRKSYDLPQLIDASAEAIEHIPLEVDANNASAEPIAKPSTNPSDDESQ